MAIKKSEVYSSLWQSCDALRGGMDASDFPDFNDPNVDMQVESTALEAKLSKARHLKQGMMQELLTGRIRLV